MHGYLMGRRLGDFAGCDSARIGGYVLKWSSGSRERIGDYERLCCGVAIKSITLIFESYHTRYCTLVLSECHALTNEPIAAKMYGGAVNTRVTVRLCLNPRTMELIILINAPTSFSTYRTARPISTLTSSIYPNTSKYHIHRTHKTYVQNISPTTI